MENLHKIELKGLVFILLVASYFTTQAQNDLFVHFLKGEPFIEQHDSIKPISRGSIIENDAILVINKKDVVHLIDDQGEVYKVNKTGNYKHLDLQKINPEKNSTSSVKLYFTYLWKQFTNAVASNRKKSGVVYRGDELPSMRIPVDSSRVYASEIQFQWKKIPEKVKDYYLILKDVETGKLTKFGTPTNELTLFIDDVLLVQGKSYQWTISETKYLDINKVDFHHFRLIDKSEFQTLEPKTKEISKYLKLLGLSKKEIKETIFEDYKIYF